MYLTLSKYYLDKCSKFADEQLETSKDLYAYRGEYRLEKMKNDIIIGKLGEIAAYKYLKSRGFEVNKPDFSIYDRYEKNFSADLVTSCGKQIHVKSQGFDSMMRYGASWLLQKSDKITKRATGEDYILMVTLNGLEANILGVVSTDDLLSKHLFEEPKVNRYAYTKKALYFNSIKEAGISLDAL